ncbi:hypothetical protein BKA62DRAFT_768561 [Auriculariales sp. MPI-PUGE-AT-0066]|nr:hypothetical protein BKA62DRAFT_768561 [Auriculariales sp. MPI-PUGE-AT-0066]
MPRLKLLARAWKACSSRRSYSVTSSPAESLIEVHDPDKASTTPSSPRPKMSLKRRTCKFFARVFMHPKPVSSIDDEPESFECLAASSISEGAKKKPLFTTNRHLGTGGLDCCGVPLIPETSSDFDRSKIVDDSADLRPVDVTLHKAARIVARLHRDATTDELRPGHLPTGDNGSTNAHNVAVLWVEGSNSNSLWLIRMNVLVEHRPNEWWIHSPSFDKAQARSHVSLLRQVPLARDALKQRRGLFGRRSGQLGMGNPPSPRMGRVYGSWKRLGRMTLGVGVLLGLTVVAAVLCLVSGIAMIVGLVV